MRVRPKVISVIYSTGIGIASTLEIKLKTSIVIDKNFKVKAHYLNYWKIYEHENKYVNLSI